MTLHALAQAAGLSGVRMGGPDVEVLRPMWDSRRVQAGDLFFCMPSARTDSHEFLVGAAKMGAKAAVIRHEAAIPLSDMAGLAWVLPEDFEDACWRLSHALLGFPTRQMKVVGVTGTNGKTTTAWVLQSMLSALGSPTAYLGTLGYSDPVGTLPTDNTTPFAPELALLCGGARDRGNKAFVMEVSSHALAQHRVDGVEFYTAIFTNLTQDHLDFHGTMESYEAAKRRLFGDLPSTKSLRAAINRDDPTGAKWLAEMPAALAYGIGDGPGLSVEIEDVGLTSLSLSFSYEGLRAEHVRVPLGGSFNISNTLSAIAGCLSLGFGLQAVCGSLAHVKPAPGRFEPVPNGRGFDVIVDYAHTPDALEKLLAAARPLVKGKVITVFGCGGDRDRTKRPKMAAMASAMSDVVIVTSDNPRTEDPAAILDEVASGIRAGIESEKIIERPAAIKRAIELAKPGDAVVIAGKGHEDYQIIGHTKYPMDDRELARKWL